MATSVPKPVEYENEIYSAGLHYSQPPFTFRSSHWDTLASKKLAASAYGYVHGNAGTNETYDKNIAAFKKWSIVPIRHQPSLTDKNGNPLIADCSTTVLGEKMPLPIAIAPVGVQRIFNPGGEIATAKAAAAVGVHYIMSTASSSPIEDVAAANGNGPRWFQLYWPGNEHNEITASILSRAKAQGFTALVVTLDTYMLGWRPMDMDNVYNPFIHADRIGVLLAFLIQYFKSDSR
jgi:lactate 2-monooxygenase